MMRARPRAWVFSALSLNTGSGLRARYLRDALERLGWEASLFAPAGPPRPCSAEVVLGVPGLLRAALAGEAPELAVGVKPYPAVWKALSLLRLRGSWTVCDVDDDDGGYRGGMLGGLTRILQAPAFWAAGLGGADAYSTHHPLLRERLRARVGERPIVALEQGVDTHLFAGPDRAARMAWRRARGLEKALILAFTAHMNVACQFDVLLPLLAPWLRRRREAVLVLFGGGPLLERFRRLAEPLGRQVRFLGPGTPADAAALLNAADLSVSAYGPGEGNRYRVPMKVGEALAMGVPVVSNLVPGLAALKPYLCTCDLDPLAYARALDAALRPAGRLRALRGQAYVRRHLAWERVAARFLDELRRHGAALPKGVNEA
jgi:glycosyltransferase involved in cell wall biosynthesis